jgi:hypothetical protein
MLGTSDCFGAGSNSKLKGYAEGLQAKLHVLIDFHNCSLVAAAVAVVGCAENGNNVFVVRPVESIHN